MEIILELLQWKAIQEYLIALLVIAISITVMIVYFDTLNFKK